MKTNELKKNETYNIKNKKQQTTLRIKNKRKNNAK